MPLLLSGDQLVGVVVGLLLLWVAPAILLGFVMGWMLLKDKGPVRVFAEPPAGAVLENGGEALKQQGPEQQRHGDNHQELPGAQIAAAEVRKEIHSFQ